MAAYGFIVGYVSLWLVWNELVGAALGPHEGWGTSQGGELYGTILCSALLPVLALSFAAYYMEPIPTRVNQMLTLMTPPLLLVFVLQQLGRLRALDA